MMVASGTMRLRDAENHRHYHHNKNSKSKRLIRLGQQIIIPKEAHIMEDGKSAVNLHGSNW
jgi:hypothetical protein